MLCLIISALCITTESFLPRQVTMLSKTDLVAVAVHPIILQSSSFFHVAQHFVLWSKLMRRQLMQCILSMTTACSLPLSLRLCRTAFMSSF